MHVSDADNLDLRIAETILRSLDGNLDPAEAVCHVERLSFQYFEKFRQAPGHVASPAILEGCLRLAGEYFSLQDRLLTCILILSSLSTRSWKAISRSEIWLLYPQFSRTTALTIIESNPCLRTLPSAASAAVSEALLRLSTLDAYERNQRLHSFPITPVRVSLQSFLRIGNGENNEISDDDKKLLSSFVHKISSEAWEAVTDEEFARVLEVVIPLGFPVDLVRNRLCGGFAKPSLSGAKLFKTLERVQDSPVASAWMESQRDGLSVLLPLVGISECHSADGISNPEEAFQFSRVCMARGQSKNLLGTAGEWLAKGQFAYVAAAYTAEPKALYRKVEGRDEIANALRQLKPSLRSEIDEALDESLADLLATVPELRSLFPRPKGKERESALTMKRKALSHPLLVGRRVGCICASGIVIITGLRDPGQRYEKCALRVLEVLFDVILALPVLSFDAEVVKRFSLAALEFLLEENRIENGIPELFAELAIVMFKVLSRCVRGDERNRLLTIALRVKDAKGTGDRIREAAEAFVMALKAQ